MHERYSLMIIIIASIIGIFVVILMMIKSARNYDKWEINENVESKMNKFKNKNDNVINLMIRNLTELCEYYIISIQQVRKAYNAAMSVCLFGFCLYSIGVVVTYFGKNVVLYTTISGSMVQLIAGLFFWLYKRSLTQLNLYHESLEITEKYLIAIQLVDKMTVEKRDEKFDKLIEVILQANSLIVSSQKASIRFKNIHNAHVN